MELLQLQYFRDAARLENFSKVAEKYYVPQSSISHTIARLESELGVKLFTRSGRRVMLNDCGRAFYEEISAGLMKIDNGIRRVGDLHNYTVRLASIEGTIAVIPMVDAFQRINPDVKIIFSNPSERLKGNLFYDVRIGAQPYRNDKTDARMPLFEERILVAMAKTHPLAQKGSVTFDEVCDLPLIGLYPGEKLYRQMQAYFELHEYTPNIRIETSNHASVSEFVRCGFGIAFVPEISWADVAAADVRLLPISDFDCKRTIYICWPKDTPQSGATKRFVDFAVTHFKKQ